MLVLLSPSQLGIHFWPEWSVVNGIRVDYLSPTIYFTDLIFFGLLIISLQKFKSSGFIKIIILVFLGLIFLSGNAKISSVYWSLRYLQVPVLAWLIFINERGGSFTKDIKRYLAFPLIFIIFLEVWQFIIKKSTGWWWIFGERYFSLSTPNIATIDILGQEFLRPYSTFSHPNALAGWLLLAMFILWDNKFNRLFAFSGVLLTFSRNAILAAGVGILFYSTLVGQGSLASLITFPQSSYSERETLNKTALNVFLKSPFFGVGPGKLLTILPDNFPSGFWSLQPPHNVFYLILAETGLFGILILFICFLKIYPLLKNSRRFFPGAMAILSTSILDHYWITSQQNRIILGIYLSLWLLNGLGSNYQASVPAVSLRVRRNV